MKTVIRVIDYCNLHIYKECAWKQSRYLAGSLTIAHDWLCVHYLSVEHIYLVTCYCSPYDLVAILQKSKFSYNR